MLSQSRLVAGLPLNSTKDIASSWSGTLSAASSGHLSPTRCFCPGIRLERAQCQNAIEDVLLRAASPSTQGASQCRLWALCQMARTRRADHLRTSRPLQAIAPVCTHPARRNLTWIVSMPTTGLLPSNQRAGNTHRLSHHPVELHAVDSRAKAGKDAALRKWSPRGIAGP